MVIRVKSSETLRGALDPIELFSCGDVNGDGDTDISDAVYRRQPELCIHQISRKELGNLRSKGILRKLSRHGKIAGLAPGGYS